jgi:hypothetical protein
VTYDWKIHVDSEFGHFSVLSVTSSLKLFVTLHGYDSTLDFAADLVNRLSWVNEIRTTGAEKCNIEMHYYTCLRLVANQAL